MGPSARPNRYSTFYGRQGTVALIIPQAAQIVCSGELTTGETWANVMHVSIGLGTFGISEAGQIGTRFYQYYDDVKGRRGSGWNLRQISVRDIRSEGTETFTTEVTDVSGGVSTPLLPPQCSLVVTLRSATNSRRGRGRVYLSGFITTHMDTQTGQATSTICNAERSSFKDLADSLLDNATPLAVASRVSGVLYMVVLVGVNSVWDTQRRRTRDLSPITTAVGEVTGT